MPAADGDGSRSHLLVRAWESGCRGCAGRGRAWIAMREARAAWAAPAQWEARRASRRAWSRWMPHAQQGRGWGGAHLMDRVGSERVVFVVCSLNYIPWPTENKETKNACLCCLQQAYGSALALLSVSAGRWMRSHRWHQTRRRLPARRMNRPRASRGLENLPWVGKRDDRPCHGPPSSDRAGGCTRAARADCLLSTPRRRADVVAALEIGARS